MNSDNLIDSEESIIKIKELLSEKAVVLRIGEEGWEKAMERQNKEA